MESAIAQRVGQTQLEFSPSAAKADLMHNAKAITNFIAFVQGLGELSEGMGGNGLIGLDGMIEQMIALAQLRTKCSAWGSPLLFHCNCALMPPHFLEELSRSCAKFKDVVADPLFEQIKRDLAKQLLCDIGPDTFDIKSLHKEIVEQQEPETLYAALISKPAAATPAAELTTALQQKAASAESANSSASAGPVPKLTPQCFTHNVAMRRS